MGRPSIPQVLSEFERGKLKREARDNTETKNQNRLIVEVRSKKPNKHIGAAINWPDGQWRAHDEDGRVVGEPCKESAEAVERIVGWFVERAMVGK